MVLAGIIVGTGTGVVCGQEKPAAVAVQPPAYEKSREVTLLGKVVGYSAASAVPPLGPHATLQSASGLIDIHLGDDRLLKANHRAIESGDTLRIIGEEVTQGSQKQFVARIVQKGTPAVVLRSANDFPLLPAAPKDSEKSQMQGGAQ